MKTIAYGSHYFHSVRPPAPSICIYYVTLLHSGGFQLVTFLYVVEQHSTQKQKVVVEFSGLTCDAEKPRQGLTPLNKSDGLCN